jgi:hypothetical protein
MHAALKWAFDPHLMQSPFSNRAFASSAERPGVGPGLRPPVLGLFEADLPLLVLLKLFLAAMALISAARLLSCA